MAPAMLGQEEDWRRVGLCSYRIQLFPQLLQVVLDPRDLGQIRLPPPETLHNVTESIINSNQPPSWIGEYNYIRL